MKAGFDAINHLTKAVDYQPDNDEYRKQRLREVSAAAGKLRDPRDVFINEIADEVDVENQRLWVEVQRAIEAGQSAMSQANTSRRINLSPWQLFAWSLCLTLMSAVKVSCAVFRHC